LIISGGRFPIIWPSPLAEKPAQLLVQSVQAVGKKPSLGQKIICRITAELLSCGEEAASGWVQFILLVISKDNHIMFAIKFLSESNTI
jgi:hypothetical protein